jgi:hypothetical protein
MKDIEKGINFGSLRCFCVHLSLELVLQFVLYGISMEVCISQATFWLEIYELRLLDSLLAIPMRWERTQQRYQESSLSGIALALNGVGNGLKLS